MIKSGTIDPGRIEELPVPVGLQKFRPADIALFWKEHFQPENDIFILHPLLLILTNAVKLARKNNNRLSRFQKPALPVQRHKAPALFHNNELHLLMPVYRNTGKIKRNRA